MNYQAARDQIKSGDIVFFSGGKRGLTRRLIEWATKGPHYHVGIAFWMTDGINERLLLAEAQPDGYRIINLGAYQNMNMTVFRCPVPWGVIADRVINSAGTVHYGLFDLVFIGLHERYGLPLPKKQLGPGDVCSVITSKILQEAGMTGLETMVSPQRLLEQLSKRQAPALIVRS